MKINKARETMSSRQRVLRTFNFEHTDRAPIGYDANPGIDARLKAALGLQPSDGEGLLCALGCDCRSVGARYRGPELFKAPPGRHVDQLEGCVMRLVEHATGSYWDFCDFPLDGASDDEIAAFPIPNPDDFDAAPALERAKAYGGEYAITIGGAGTPDIINSNGRIMGMENILCDLITEREATLDFVRRRAESQLRVLERTLDACRGYVDVMLLGEDLGTQIAPMISLELYRKVFKPIHRQFVALADAYGIPCMVHTCGSSSWAYEDFIEIGVRGVDTLQPEAANMSPDYLISHFGGRLNFRGCISTAGELAYGTAESTRAVCLQTLEKMRACRGYHFAPTHQIQDNTPTENAIAMYNAVHEFGAM